MFWGQKLIGVGGELVASIMMATMPMLGFFVNWFLKKVAPPKTCFVIMPFVERDDSRPTGFFAEVLRQIFTPAATQAGFRVQTARRPGTDVIQSTIVNDLLQDMIDGHFKFYKQVTDNPEFAKTFLDWLFERYLCRAEKS